MLLLFFKSILAPSHFLIDIRESWSNNHILLGVKSKSRSVLICVICGQKKLSCKCMGTINAYTISLGYNKYEHIFNQGF